MSRNARVQIVCPLLTRDQCKFLDFWGDDRPSSSDTEVDLGCHICFQSGFGSCTERQALLSRRWTRQRLVEQCNAFIKVDRTEAITEGMIEIIESFRGTAAWRRRCAGSRNGEGDRSVPEEGMAQLVCSS